MYNTFSSMGQTNSYQAPPGYKLVPDPTYSPSYGQRNIADQVRYSLGQNQSSSAIPARITPNSDDIRPNETPEDGTPALFLQSDFRAIYATQKNKNGLIDFVKYVPDIPAQSVQNETPTANLDLTPINTRLDNIEALLGKLNALWVSPNQADAATTTTL